MNGELIDSAWRVLPNEFKEEVKKRYKGCLFTANRYAKVEADLLEEFFGINNLTSDAEGEEMLTISAKQVERWLDEAEAEIHKSTNGMYSSGYWNGKKEVYKKLLGPKCLPDEEPQPTEPKFREGDKIRILSLHGRPTQDKGEVDVIAHINASNKEQMYYLENHYHCSYGFSESDLEPYTEPTGLDKSASTCTNVCPSQSVPNPNPETVRNLRKSDEDSESKALFIHIPDTTKMVENRLQIAAMAMQGLLTNEGVSSFTDIQELEHMDFITYHAFEYADKLIKKAKEDEEL